MLTRQQIFDKVYTHFVFKKKPPSYNRELGCVYYDSENGNRCAVGLFLTKPEAIACNPINGIASVIEDAPEIYERHFKHSDSDFLEQLQSCHDYPASMRCTGSEFTADMRKRLDALRKKFKLRITRKTNDNKTKSTARKARRKA